MVGLPTGLRLVIDNAIANAVKHGGATEIQLNVASSGDGVEIAIDDNGTGVPEAERTAVFERFSRGSTASRSGLRVRAGAGRPAGRIARWQSVSARQSAGRHAPSAEAGR